MQPQFQFLSQFLDQFGASDGLDFASPRPLDALKWISPPARCGKKDVCVKKRLRWLQLLFVQQVIHERLAFVLGQAIPMQSSLGAGLTQLCLAKPQSFLPAALRVLRESQQDRALAFGWQLPHQRNHLLVA